MNFLSIINAIAAAVPAINLLILIFAIKNGFTLVKTAIESANQTLTRLEEGLKIMYTEHAKLSERVARIEGRNEFRHKVE